MQTSTSVLFDDRLEVKRAPTQLLRGFQVFWLLTHLLLLLFTNLYLLVQLRIRVDAEVRLDSPLRLRAARASINALTPLGHGGL